VRIGVTGHQHLDDSGGWPWVEGAIRGFLAGAEPPLVGITSLAMGADQLFAREVLRAGGTLHVVVPFPDYGSTFSDGAARDEYERLLDRAGRAEVLPRLETDEHSFFAAGKRVVDLSDALVAVWNGRPAAGLGGTADVVGYAARLGRRIHHVDPVKRSAEMLRTGRSG
jgi:hypothetical protein